mmetsp:Transcript_38228/g.53065  ORF Transcript_38228/g.53065 Transcript_38228/m.53065 type:complete len:206 (-) Transcript_38228:573-1190(-)
MKYLRRMPLQVPDLHIYNLDISVALLADAMTASMSAPLTPLSSIACNPAMVVPPGEVTMSFKAPGCLPVSITILDAPYTVCAARDMAMSRGRPARTPPSANASIITNTYAGPLPLSPVTASSSFSSTLWMTPTDAKRAPASFSSASSQPEARHMAAAVCPTRVATLGITRTTRVCPPAASMRVDKVSPAAMETIKVFGEITDLIS